MRDEFCKQLSLVVINVIASSKLGYAEKMMMKEIKSELTTLHSLGVAGGSLFFHSKFFKIESRKDSYILKPMSGGKGIVIDKENKPYLDHWIKQAPKPLNLEEWKTKYGK